VLGKTKFVFGFEKNYETLNGEKSRDESERICRARKKGSPLPDDQRKKTKSN